MRIKYWLNRTKQSLKDDGIKVTVKRAARKIKRKMFGTPAPEPVVTPAPEPPSIPISQLFAERFCNMQPIECIHIKNGPKRLNLVTDSISNNSLLGGVATAIIVAALFCKKNNIPLRIITRFSFPEPDNLKMILNLNGLDDFNDIEFYTDVESNQGEQLLQKLDISDNDIFFATSWWSAYAIKKISLRTRFFYIIQEVETFFYPHGDEHYFCSKILEDKNIDFIINHQNLLKYFNKNFPTVAQNGIAFMPAFSRKLYLTNSFIPQKKKKLFFYSRPNNPRNMFWTGIKLLDKAIQKGVLNTSEWEIFFAGQDVPRMVFTNGYKPICNGLMTWEEYGKFLGSVDLTLSLMYTPHPSYPPYDAACAGSVVLTNKCLNKTEFPECKNIITTNLDESDFYNNLSIAMDLATNMVLRKSNFEEMTIPSDWEKELENVMKFMEERI